MPPKKRKLDHMTDNDDDASGVGEEPTPGRQILPVANLPDDFTGIPQDGMQYLFTVRRDAQRLPQVTRVPNPFEVQSPVLPLAVLNTNLHNALPSTEWRSTCELRFRNFRRNTQQIEPQPFDVHVQTLIPEKKERDRWWAFLAGKPESEWKSPPKRTVSKKATKFGGMRGFPSDDVPEVPTMPPPISNSPSDSIHLSEEIATSEGSTTVRSCGPVYPREPVPSFLQSIDERMAFHLLMYFTHWLNQHLTNPSAFVLTEAHARWIFSLLSRIDDFVTADDMNLLRNLARAMISLLRRLNTENNNGTSVPPTPDLVDGEPSTSCGKMSQKSCWILLTIILNSWKQHDLWLEAEEAAIPSETSPLVPQHPEHCT